MNARHIDSFKHSGFVSKINHSTITVSLEQNMHCESCRAKSSCGISESTFKEVDITTTNETFEINEKVDVLLEKSLGLKAIFWAYVVPFMLLFSTILVSSSFLNELIAGILSLLVLIPYYTMLYFLKNKLKSTFQISILKHN